MAADRDETEEALHPAAHVFRSVVLGDIGGDNARLREEIFQHQPLLEYSQEITIKAPVDDEPLSHKITEEVNDHGVTIVRYPVVNLEVISKASLSQGTLLHDEGGDKLTFPIVSSPPLLLENVGDLGGIRLCVANDVMSLRLGRGHTAVSVGDDDAASLTIFLSEEVSIQCELNGLADEDLMAFKEGSYDADRLTSMLVMPGYFIRRTLFLSNQGEGVTVTPTLLSMDVTPTLRNTLDDIMKATISTAPVGDSRELSPSDELLKLTIEAVGDDEQKHMLADNRRFKLQRDALVRLKERVLSVDLTHGGKSLRLSLDEGELHDFQDGAKWCIRVKNRDNSSMVVNDIFSSICSSSGNRLITGCIEGRGMVLPDEDGSPLYFSVCYSSWLPGGIEVIGRFNFHALTGDDLSNILDGNFYTNLWNGGDNRPFPDSFEVDIIMIRFHPVLVVHALTAVGLGDKLVKADK